MSKTTIKNKNVNPIPLPVLGLIGAFASCIAEIFTFPFDNIKTRLQMNGKMGLPTYSSTGNCIVVTFSSNGINGFYRGISAGLLRQITYGYVKFGTYEYCKKLFVLDAKDSSFIKKFIAGGVAGGFGCIAGNPFDVLKIRLINDINGEKYKGISDAIRQTISKDGYPGFYKGLKVNITRAIVLNAAELSSFDHIKNLFEKYLGMSKTGLVNIFFSSCTAGLFASFASSPFDVIKSRFMNQLKSGGTHTSATSCALDVFKNEGIGAFYKGFIPYFSRIGPWSVIFFVCYEKSKNFIKDYYM